MISSSGLERITAVLPRQSAERVRFLAFVQGQTPSFIVRSLVEKGLKDFGDRELASSIEQRLSSLLEANGSRAS